MQRQQRRLRAATLLVCVFLLSALSPQRARAEPRAAATVTSVVGELLVRHKGASIISALPLRGALYAGDIVRTGPNGRATLLFSDGAQVKLNVNTTVEIRPDSGGKGRQSLLGVLWGEVWAKLRPGQRVHSKFVNLLVRGTEIDLAVAGDGATLTVVEGVVQFFNEQGTVVVGASQQSTARADQSPTPPVVVDVSGLVAWTAEIAGLPVEFETPFISPNPAAARSLRREREAQVRIAPDRAEAHYRLGEVLHDSGEYAAAVPEFEAAVRLRPGDAAGYVGLGQAKRGRGDVPGALAAFKRALQLSPDNPSALLGLGLTYLAQGDQRQARAALEAAPRHAPAQAVLGLIDLYRGQGAAAVEQLQTALAQDPQLYQARALLALAYLTQGRLPRAEQAARKAARLQAGSAQTQGILAMVLFFTGQPKEAARAARRAVALNPLSPFALLTQGRVLLSQLRTDEARLAYEQAAALAPYLWIVHNELGAVYLRLDRAETAEKEYRRALELNPNSADAHTGRGIVLERQGRFREAEVEHKQALALDPNNTTARGNLAALFIERGQFDQAQRQLEQGILQQPERGILYARAAELSLYRQNLFAAQEFARRAVQLLPGSAIAHYQLGRVFLEQERILQAEQEFRQAVTLDPQFAAARYALGVTQEKTEAGLLGSFSSLSGSATVGSPGSPQSLENLQTPGAEQRIQAALQDPTVVRAASRSYGDAQLDGITGEQGTRDLAASFLGENDDRRGVRGLTGERQRTRGVRGNADSTLDRVSLVLGQKAKDNPSGLFVSGEYEWQERGLDIGVTSNPDLATQRFRSRLPRLLVGSDLRSNERSRTRFLVQGSKAEFGNRDLAAPDNRNDFDIRSLNTELRYDTRVGEKHSLSAGFSSGTRRRRIKTLLPGFPFFEIDFNVRARQAYLRDEINVNGRLSLTGEIQLHRLDLSTIEPKEFEEFQPPINRRTNVALPNFILAYRPDARSGFRLRARRLSATIQDFQLLTPTDVFLLSFAGLPQAVFVQPQADGRSVEMEYDHTFRDASFLRLALFRQDLNHADIAEASAEAPLKTRVQGARASCEGLLGRDLSFSVGVDLNDAKERDTGLFLAQVPRFAGVANLHYLNRAGYFAQGVLYYQGSRVLSAEDRTRLGGFSVLNLRMGKQTGLRSAVFVEWNNVFDRRYDAFGVLQPGRQLRSGVSLRF